MYCSNCGNQIDNNAVVCVHCGVRTSTPPVPTAMTSATTKYCSHCGAPMHEQAVICVQCGRTAEPGRRSPAAQNHSLVTIIKIFLIIACISQGWLLIPLLWCIPITIHVFSSLNHGRPIGVGTKIAVLLLMNMVSGICLLCMDDN